MIPAPPSRAPATPAALGLDAGGTATRWALADAQGQLLAEGQVGGLTALMMGQAAGQAELRATVRQIRGALDGAGAPQELAVVAERRCRGCFPAATSRASPGRCAGCRW